MADTTNNYSPIGLFYPIINPNRLYIQALQSICIILGYMLAFWKNVKDELDYKMMSQKELAAMVKISYNTLQSWLTKDRLPDAADSVKIAKALGVSVEYLVTGKRAALKSEFSPEINAIINDAEHLGKEDLNILKLMAKRLASSSLRH